MRWQYWQRSTRSPNLEVQDYKLRNDTPAISDHVPVQFNINVEPIYANNYHRWNVREFEQPDPRKVYNEETKIQIDAIQWHEINSVEDLWSTTKKVIQNSTVDTLVSGTRKSFNY
jgi:hypothetical protein